MSAVRAATIDDLPRLCRTTMHAFADDPVMRWLYPADDDYYAGDGQVLRYVFRRWLAHGSTFTTDDCVSVAAFVPPGRPPVDVQVEPDMPAFAEDLVDKFMAISACLAEHTPAEPHWYLNSLATHPHWQRQGLGRRLMQHLIKVAREYRAQMMFLEVRPSNVSARRLYEDIGFNEIATRRAYYPAHDGREDALLMGLAL